MTGPGLPWELLLGPAVWSVPGVGRRPGAVPAEVDVRLAAVLHWASVLGLIHQAGHVRHSHRGCKLVDRGRVASLARSSGPAVDDGLGREGQVGEPVAGCYLKSEERDNSDDQLRGGSVQCSPVRQSRESSLGPTRAAGEKRDISTERGETTYQY